MTEPSEDPLIRHARREALAIALVAVLATTCSVGYCTLFGYGRAGEPVRFVLGFPAWVFWGIVVPWGVCVVIAGGFSWWFMSDDELGAQREDEDET
jgi:hypothetical protein